DVVLDQAKVVQRFGGVHRVGQPEQVVEVAFQALQVGIDITYRVVDFVSYTRRQLADGRQLFRLKKLAIGLFKFFIQGVLVGLGRSSLCHGVTCECTDGAVFVVFVPSGVAGAG